MSTTRGRGRPRIFDEDAWLQSATSDEISALLIRAFEADESPGQARGLVTWLHAKKAGEEPRLASDTAARFRRLLADLVGGDEAPVGPRGGAADRIRKGAASLVLVPALGLSGAALFEARSAQPARAATGPVEPRNAEPPIILDSVNLAREKRSQRRYEPVAA